MVIASFKTNGRDFGFCRSRIWFYDSKKVLDKFDANVCSLQRNPNRGILDSDLSDSQFTVRHLQLFPNVLYYVVKGDFIIITAVMHYKQSPKTVYKTVMRSLESYR